METGIDRLCRCGMQASAAWHVESFAAGAIHFMNEINQPGLTLVARLQKNSAGAVAEQDAG